LVTLYSLFFVSLSLSLAENAFLVPCSIPFTVFFVKTLKILKMSHEADFREETLKRRVKKSLEVKEHFQSIYTKFFKDIRIRKCFIDV